MERRQLKGEYRLERYSEILEFDKIFGLKVFVAGWIGSE